MNNFTTYSYQKNKAASMLMFTGFLIPVAAGLLASIWIARVRHMLTYDTTWALYIFVTVFALGATVSFNVAFWNWIDIKKIEESKTASTNGPPPLGSNRSGRAESGRAHGSVSASARAAMDRLEFNQRHRTRAVSVDGNGNGVQYILSYYSFDMPQWFRLLKELRYARWKWNKRILRKTKLFTVDNTGASIDASNVYGVICERFEAGGFIVGSMGNWKITVDGYNWLHDLAGVTDVPPLLQE